MLYKVVDIFFLVVLVSGVGYFTAIVQKFTILKLKDNVESLEVEIGDLLEVKNQIQKSMLEELANHRSQNQWSKDVINQMN